jgi:hypothetical protein
MAPSLQYRQTPFVTWILIARTTGFYANATPSRWSAGYAVVSLALVQNIRQARRFLISILLGGIVARDAQLTVRSGRYK